MQVARLSLAISLVTQANEGSGVMAGTPLLGNPNPT